MSKVLVLGGSGFVGKHLHKYIQCHTYKKLTDWIFVSSKECNLASLFCTDKAIYDIKPDYIVNLAATVGGINANMNKQYEFFYNNNLIGHNVYMIAAKYNIPTLSMLSTCCFEDCHDVGYPLKEKYVLSGTPELSNEGYAIAKRNMAHSFLMANKYYGQNHKMLVPCNIMGEFDHFDLSLGHFVASLIKKVYEAKDTVEFWGDGTPLRQFIHADTLCDVIVHFIDEWNNIPYEIVNVCPDYNYTIKDMVHMVVQHSGKQLEVKFDNTKPNGIHRKDGDNTLLRSIMPNLTFPDIKLQLAKLYDEYSNQRSSINV